MLQNGTQPLLTKQEAAALLRVSLRTLDRWRESGALVPVELGDGIRSVRYRRCDVDALIAGRPRSA